MISVYIGGTLLTGSTGSISTTTYSSVLAPNSDFETVAIYAATSADVVASIKTDVCTHASSAITATSKFIVTQIGIV